MKNYILYPFTCPGVVLRGAWVLPALIVCLSLMPAGRVTAQTFTTVHGFTGGSDGGAPESALILSGGVLYGTAASGGTNGSGSVFAVNTDGTGFTNVYSFTNGTDGNYPNSSLVLSGNTLYGTAYNGGANNNGTVFSVNTNGTGFTLLHSFTARSNNTNSDGGSPQCNLVLSGSTLYGTASRGGAFGSGSLFAVNTNGTGFTNLYNFTAVSGSFTNGDGSRPEAGLLLAGNKLFGTAYNGGTNGNGAVFAVNTNGTGFTTLHSFTTMAFDGFGNDTNSDGANPYGSLVLSGNTLYGTTVYGGNGGSGVVFALNTNGTGFTILHSFTASSNSTNSDGVESYAGLILSGNTLYGTAEAGGISTNGTVFSVNTNGTGFTTLHNFTGGGDGGYPAGALILSSNILYGTASTGDILGNGTVFSISFAPQLSITSSTANVVLSWPTNVSGLDFNGFKLQSTTNLGSAAVWITNSTVPSVVSGQRTITNPVSGTQKFFRVAD